MGVQLELVGDPKESLRIPEESIGIPTESLQNPSVLVLGSLGFLVGAGTRGIPNIGRVPRDFEKTLTGSLGIPKRDW